MKAATTPPARLLTDEQAGDYTGTSKQYIRALHERGILKRVELPTTDGSPGCSRSLRFDVRDVDRWLDGLPRQ